ncbi:MAG: aldose 1-epimerase family protein [Flavobacteriaceae bacterium]
MFTLENDVIKIAVLKTGAELCQITSKKYDTPFMWHASPEIWGSYAPNLFPIIGALKNNSYNFNGATYNMPKHGIVRNNPNIELHTQEAHSITLKLVYNQSSLEVYPFKFEFYITFVIKDNRIRVEHTVLNKGETPMYFSLGGHPAFKCPVFEGEEYNDYYLGFEYDETSKTHLIDMESGLISNQTKPILNQQNTLPLTHDLFNSDALIFKDLKSKKVSLNSKTHGKILTVNYADFNYLGIWAKPNGNFLCIEPWLGIADSVDTNQDFKTKEGIMQLMPKTSFKATYSIEIDQRHLI